MKTLFLTLAVVLCGSGFAQHIISNPSSKRVTQDGQFLNNNGRAFTGFTQEFKAAHVKKEEFSYALGYKNGPAAIYHSNGELKEFGNHLNNKRYGEWKTWDRYGNLLHSISYNQEGAKNGLGYAYHRNGAKKTQMMYTNGQKSGTWIWWDKDGNIVKTEQF